MAPIPPASCKCGSAQTPGVTDEDRHNKLLHLLRGTGSMPTWEGIQPGKDIQLHQVQSFLATVPWPLARGFACFNSRCLRSGLIHSHCTDSLS